MCSCLAVTAAPGAGGPRLLTQPQATLPPSTPGKPVAQASQPPSGTQSPQAGIPNLGVSSLVAPPPPPPPRPPVPLTYYGATPVAVPISKPPRAPLQPRPTAAAKTFMLPNPEPNPLTAPAPEAAANGMPPAQLSTQAAPAQAAGPVPEAVSNGNASLLLK